MTHPDPDLLADLDAGLLDPARARQVRAAALADPRAATVLDALRATRADLAALPTPTAPPAAVQRWLDALTADQAATSGAAARQAGGAPAPGPLPPGAADAPAPTNTVAVTGTLSSTSPASGSPGSPAPDSAVGTPGHPEDRHGVPNPPAGLRAGRPAPDRPGTGRSSSGAPAGDLLPAREPGAPDGRRRPSSREPRRSGMRGRAPAAASGRMDGGGSGRVRRFPSARPARLRIAVTSLLAAAAVVVGIVVAVAGGRGSTVDVTRVELAAVARSTIGVSELGPFTDVARRDACLVTAGHPGATVLGGREVRFDGSPGVLLVLSTGVLGRLRVLVVDNGCGTLADDVFGR